MRQDVVPCVEERDERLKLWCLHGYAFKSAEKNDWYRGLLVRAGLPE